MLRIITPLVVFFTTFSFSYSQIITYDIPTTDLIGMVINSGDFCFDPGEYKQATIGNTWGFTWNSTNSNTPSSVTVDIIFTIEEANGPYPTTLNGLADAPVSPAFASCGFSGATYTLNPANYNPLGLNTFLMDYSGTTQQNQIIAGFCPGCMARVTVDYTPCIDPDLPTLTTLTDTVCDGDSATINIAGNLNSATNWHIYTGGCGTTPLGTTAASSFVVTPSAPGTTYYIRGEGGCITPGACQSITIAVDDNEAPVPDIGTLSDINAECSSSPTTPTATDNCAGPGIIGTPDVTFPITTQGTTVVTWTYDDGNGNTSIQTQNVILNDVTSPAPDLGTLSDVTAECSASLTAPTATDNCAGFITGTPDVTFPITAQGTTVVTWTYDDGNGNTATQTQNVILNDVTSPAPDVGSLSDVTAECSASPTAPGATDNCTGSVTGTPDVTFPVTAQGTTVVTWTFDDGNGNTATQTQNVIINDITPPTFSGCPADISITANNAGCMGIVTWTPPVEADNCAGVTVSSSHNSGDSFPIGTTTVSYTATDIGGNTAMCSFNVTVTNDLVAVVDSVTDVDCFGNSSGAIAVTTSGGTMSYVFDWNSGTYSTEDISSLPAGVYTLSVTDANGCTATTNTSVNEPATALLVTVDSTGNPSSCGGSDGIIDITTAGGTGPYSWDWNSGTYSTEDVTGLSAGSYNLLVTDFNGCSTTTSVSLNDPGAPLVSLDSITDASCFGASDGSIAITVTGGTPGYTFDWDHDGTGDNDDSEDLTLVAAGSYSVVVIDTAGCTGSVTGTISEPAAIDTSVTQSGQLLTANATGVSYQWIDCGTMLPMPGETSASYNATANGSYAVEITDGACVDTSSCYNVFGVGIAQSAALDIRIYPNPTSGVLNLTMTGFSDDLTLVLYDIKGRLVRTKEIPSIQNSNVRLDLSDLDGGTYLLRLISADHVSSVTVVRQ